MPDQIETLHDLFELKLQGLHDAEKQLVKALTKLAGQATDPRLRLNLEQHLDETKIHVKRLEDAAFNLNLNLDLKGPACQAMASLIAEGQQHIARCTFDEVRDAAIIGAAQAIEHYEIAQYGTAVYFARCLAYEVEASLLTATLDEEKKTDELLNQLAVNSIDTKAMS
jgi:ferritin-like metal-binding protein YciE